MCSRAAQHLSKTTEWGKTPLMTYIGYACVGVVRVVYAVGRQTTKLMYIIHFYIDYLML